METTLTQSIKLLVLSATALSKDALHIYVGLFVFFFTAFMHPRRLASFLPWIAVIAIASAGEILDMKDDLASFGYWRWSASLHDVANTIFWPTVMMVIFRKSTLFGGTNASKV